MDPVASAFDIAEIVGLFALVVLALCCVGVANLRRNGTGLRWLAVRSNLAVLSDVSDWWQVVSGPLQPVIADAALCGEAAALR